MLLAYLAAYKKLQGQSGKHVNPESESSNIDEDICLAGLSINQ